jgi:hypothetical protein
MGNIIRIVATCELFSIEEEVSEKKAVARLKQIKKLFTDYKKPYTKTERLKVTTTLVNPQLF